MAEELTSKKQKINKNKKKNWRKVDISEVEEVLEDERLQERTGGLVAEKPDESLFFIDKNVPSSSELEEVTSSKRRKREPKPLKCHAYLHPDPSVKPARIAKNIKSQTKKKSALISERQKKAHTVKLLKSLAQREKTQNEKRRVRLELSQFNTSYDLWSDNKPEPTEDLHYLTVTRKRRANIPKHYNDKPSNVEAVQVPHPGASYNPAYDDYQDLLKKACDIELKKKRDEEKIHRALDAKFPTRHEAPNERTWLKEMSAGLNDNETHISESENETNDRLSANPSVRREKKTRKQRKTQIRIKREERNRRRGKSNKMKNREVFRLKTLKKEIKEEERLKMVKQVRQRNLRNRYSDKPKKLGKLKFEEADLEVKLSDELVDSLRKLKPEGHLLTDRFKSLQRRNIIEPRERATIKRKYKRKKYVRRSHKDVS